MFEKEAEEYAKSKKIKDDCIRFYDTKKHFKDGAEFGYNKGKNETKEIIKDLLSLCEGETDSKLVFARAEQFLKENEV